MGKKSIVGIEVVDYVAKSGSKVSGVRLYISKEITGGCGVGVSVTSEFLSGKSLNDFKLGPIQAVLYEPTFNGQYRCIGVLA